MLSKLLISFSAVKLSLLCQHPAVTHSETGARAAALWAGLAIIVSSLVTITSPGGAPFGFLMFLGLATVTGALVSFLALLNQAARSAANCRSAGLAVLHVIHVGMRLSACT